MSNQEEFSIKFDDNTIVHLGRNMYSNIPAALGELIANCWDADSTEVKIKIDNIERIITIEDNGIGMSRDDVDNRYLNISYDRRAEHGDETKNKRKVVGRKGIGKLASFSIADSVQLETKSGTQETVAFNLAFDENAQKGTKKATIVAIDNTGWQTQGTKLTLKLRPRKHIIFEKIIGELFRRYEGMLKQQTFKVIINETPLDSSVNNILYNDTVSILLINSDIDILPFSPTTHKIHTFNDENNDPEIKGWIGVLDTSQHKGLNKIGIYALDRIVLDNIIPYVTKNQIIENTYLYGGIYADFCDNTSIDMATSSRQGFDEEDERFLTLQSRILPYIKKIIKHTEKATEEKVETELSQDPAFQNWLNSLKEGKKRQFVKNFVHLLAKSEIRDIAKQKDILYGLAIGFTESDLRDKTHIWDDIQLNSDNLEGFSEYFKNFQNLEASSLYPIISEKLKRLDQLSALLDNKDLDKESDFQKLIAENMWLVTTDRYPRKYESLKEQAYFKRLLDGNTEKRNFIDILLFSDDTTEPPLIIELKKKKRLDLNSYDILSQITGYRLAIFNQLPANEKAKLNSHSEIPAIIIVEYISDMNDAVSINKVKMNASNDKVTIIFYSELIENAKIRFTELKEELEKVNKSIKFLDAIKESFGEIIKKETPLN